MNPKVEIFSQGEEVVTGQVADTNAAWLSQQLVAMGFSVSRHTAVGDKISDLISLLKEIASRADCCICTGGLGPTTDDLTAEAVGKAFDLPLQFDEVGLQQINRYFQQRNITMPEVNRKQAMLPQSSIRIDNEWGTAPGFCLQYQHCWFVFLPGVPYEMQHLFTEKVQANLQTRFALQAEKLVALRTFGIGESALQEKMNQLILPEAVTIGYRAALDEVQVKLLFPHHFDENLELEITQKIAAEIGDYVFAIAEPDKPAGDLVAVIGELMNATAHTLAVLETASQGLIAAKCIGHDWLLESSYKNNVCAMTGSPPKDCQSFLFATAQEMGKSLRISSGASFALVQLYDNKHNFSNKNQPITLYTVLLTVDGFCQHTKTVSGTSQRKQNQAALFALDLLRRFLQQKEPLCPYYD